MSLKDSFNRQLHRLSTDYLPAAVRSVEGRLEQLRSSWDDLNRSLASRALPDDRKSRVGRLALDRKASKAGQGRRAGKAGKKVAKSARR